jgi:hypothetical protein
VLLEGLLGGILSFVPHSWKVELPEVPEASARAAARSEARASLPWGVGNTYNFKAGVKYSVPSELANYLEGLGYIWRPN